MIFSIFSPSAGAVKPRRHSRILRADITAPEIDPALRAFGRHIARSHCEPVKGWFLGEPEDITDQLKKEEEEAGSKPQI